jgi:hypothetical protein
MDIVKTFLDVWGKIGKRVRNPLRDMPVSIQGTRAVSPVRKLRSDSRHYLTQHGSHRPDMLVYLTTNLPAAYQNHRGAKKTGVSDKAAGVSYGATSIRENLQIIFWGEICENSEPLLLCLIPEHTNGFADVIGAGVDVRPQKNALHF